MSTLHFVTAYSNPCGYRNRERRFYEFYHHLKSLSGDAELTVAECAYNGDAHVFSNTSELPMNHLALRASTILWHKECQLNAAFRALPPNWKKAVWIDADIRFLNPNVIAETKAALDHYAVIQPWNLLLDMDVEGFPMEVHQSFCDRVMKGQPIVQGPRASDADREGVRFGHSGFAWAITRDAYEAMGGLLDIGILGAGDHMMAMGLLGRIEEATPPNVPAFFLNELLKWQYRVNSAIRREDIGCVPGVVEHGFHGLRKNRFYRERWSITIDHDFDPYNDVLRNDHGLLEFVGNKPKLEEEVVGYFESRKEDES
jgi:hypothetical protein